MAQLSSSFLQRHTLQFASGLCIRKNLVSSFFKIRISLCLCLAGRASHISVCCNLLLSHTHGKIAHTQIKPQCSCHFIFFTWKCVQSWIFDIVFNPSQLILVCLGAASSARAYFGRQTGNRKFLCHLR